MKLALAMAMGLVIAACGGSAGDPPDSPTAVETTESADTTEAEPVETTSVEEDPAVEEVEPSTVSTTETSLGTVLVDGDGRTLYIFTVDQGDVSACYDECEAAWPVVPAGASLAEGVSAAAGSTTRDDGNEQLTLNGRPVYLFAGDEAPGDVNGQGLNDVWYVIGADGEPRDGLVAATDTALGSILVDEGGRTLYIFTVDVDGVSACYEECEDAWPVVPAGAVVGEGLDLSTGFTLRDDGSEQLTVNNRPVYLFAGDAAPGDVNGQGLNDVWFVIGIDGEPIGIG